MRGGHLQEALRQLVLPMSMVKAVGELIEILLINRLQSGQEALS